MVLEIIPLGGYSEVGRNSVAIKVDNEIFILDMGLAIDKYIEYTEQESYDEVNVSGKKLIEIGAAPDINILDRIERKKVKAIILTHAHLDHILAVPYLANKFKAPLYATPFTAEIIKTITDDERRPLKNNVFVKNPGDLWGITEKVSCEFIHITHSTPHTVVVALHTPYGVVLYAPDFKFDEHPTKGRRSDTKRLSELKGAKALIMDSLYAHKDDKVPSENYARSMLFNILTKEYTENKVILATTFASHIYRLQTFIELAKKLGRRPVFLGRSLAKYISAAEKLGLANFSDSTIVPYGSKIRTALKKIKDPENCLFVSTGNQGEPKAALSKIITQDWLPFEEGDLVVFSSITIPVEPNITYRNKIELLIKKKRLELLKDIHVSGHGAQKDHKMMLDLVKPENIIPMHAEPKKLALFKKNATKWGFKNILILHNGERKDLP